MRFAIRPLRQIFLRDSSTNRINELHPNLGILFPLNSCAKAMRTRTTFILLELSSERRRQNLGSSKTRGNLPTYFSNARHRPAGDGGRQHARHIRLTVLSGRRRCRFTIPPVLSPNIRDTETRKYSAKRVRI